MFIFTMPDFPNATWLPSTHFFLGHANKMPKWVQVHTRVTDKSPLEVATEREVSGESVHYIVGIDGSVVQCVSELHSSTGAGILTFGNERFWNQADGRFELDHLSFTVEILLEPMEDGYSYSQEALNTAFALIKNTVEHHQIPKQIGCETGGVVGKCSSDPVRAPSSGKNFPYLELVGYLEGESPVPVVPERPKKVETPKADEVKVEKKTAKPAKVNDE